MAQQTHLEAASKPSSAVISNGVLQRKCACGTHASGGECEACSKQCQTLQRATRDPELQTRNSDGVPLIVRDVLRSPGQPLDAQTRAFMQPRFGSDFSTVPVSTAALQRSEEALSVGPANDIYEQEAEQIADRVTTGEPKESQWNTGMDFSHVRVHADAKAAESARAVGALAYTVGSDLVFGGGQYAPTTTAGRHLLAHELAHVVQQKSGLSRHLQRASITYRQLTWADFKASVPADSPFGAVTSSGIDVPVWKSKVDITDTKEACEVKKIKATKHTAKLLIEPTEFDKVQATMTQEKS